MSRSGERVLQDRYRLVQRLGRGGMGTVWRAHDEMLEREVAVKEILLPPGLDEAELAVVRGRALREARAAAKIRHPAVVTIHDVVIQDEHPWIVMDLVRARSLADKLTESGALSIVGTARLGAALASALGTIHRHKIVHRDLKPANVLFADDGEVVLTDFGIAVIEGDSRLTRSGLLIGTPGYIAPECLEGDLAEYASDLWSLGAVLFEAVEGRPAYAGSTPAVLSAAVLKNEPAPQVQSGRLAPLLTALLARDPDARPDARTAAARLEEIAGLSEGKGDLPGSDPPEPFGSRTTPGATVHPDKGAEADKVRDRRTRRARPSQEYAFHSKDNRVRDTILNTIVFIFLAPPILIAATGVVVLIIALVVKVF